MRNLYRVFRHDDGNCVNIRNRTPFHRLPVFRLLQLQALVGVFAAGVCGVLYGFVAGYSGLLGGLIAWLANLYLGYRAFRYFGARSVRAVVQSFWAGELGKLILTAVLFALVFVGVRPLNPFALLGGYLLVLGAGASALLLVRNNPKY